MLNNSALLFLNSKYLWGGKTSDGIDCSALIQMFYFFNNRFSKFKLKNVNESKNIKNGRNILKILNKKGSLIGSTGRKKLLETQYPRGK